jgi:hypothetical protein
VTMQVAVDSPPFAALMAKHRRFWRRAEDSLLRSCGLFASSAPVRLLQSDGTVVRRVRRLSADMIDPTAMVAEAAAWGLDRVDSTLPEQGQFMIAAGLGDQMPIAHCLAKVPWLEAMLGCPVEMTDGQIWSEPYDGDVEELIRRGANFDHNPWLQLYEEMLRQVQDKLSAHFVVTANTLLRGTCDLVAAVLGVRDACITWLDDPTLASRLMRVCTDANLAVIEAGNRIAQPFQGGHMCGYGIWAPGTVLRTQADHSTLLSPRIYETQIMPYDIEIIRSCSYSVFHLHNPGLHVAPLLLQIPELSAIQVVVDPYPNAARRPYEVEMYHLIQESKPLILDVNFPDQGEADALLSELSPRGLCYNARFEEKALAAVPGDAPGRQAWVIA